jgi:Spy/CpxP family protein refolding chaperone
MTNFKRLAALLLISTASLGAMAADADQDNWWTSFKGYTHQQKREAVVAGKKFIAETDAKLTELAKQAKNSTVEAKAANEKNMAELQEKKKAAQIELAKMEKSSGAVWDATKTGFANAGKELGLAYDKAVEAAKN